MAVVPPVVAIFSSTTMFSTPASAALMAAARPEIPEPTMTMPAVRSSSVLTVSPPSTGCFRASISAPACLAQSSTAARMALEVMVAPATVSTPRL